MENKINNKPQNIDFAESGGEKDASANHVKADLSNMKNSSVEAVTDTAKDVLDKTKDSVGQFYELAAEKTTSKIEEQKSNLVGGIAGVADSIRQVGKNLREGDEHNAVTDLTAKYGETVAKQLDKVSGYIDQKELNEIVRDVEHFARRQPAIFIGAAFLAGLATARFLKSGSGDLLPKKLKKPADEDSHQDKPKTTDNQSRQVNQTAVNAV